MNDSMMIAEHLRSSERAEQPAEFFDRLDQVRGRGYEMMASLQTAGVYNLSAPILAPNGRAMAALTIPYIALINMPSARRTSPARSKCLAKPPRSCRKCRAGPARRARHDRRHPFASDRSVDAALSLAG
jgi:hypothetical protein